MITLTISGSLYDDLRDGTSLGENWGYGGSTATDMEVFHMVHNADGVRQGFGWRYTMTGSVDAWMAIRDFASDRAYIESAGAGDFDRALGRRLAEQVERITAALPREGEK